MVVQGSRMAELNRHLAATCRSTETIRRGHHAPLYRRYARVVMTCAFCALCLLELQSARDRYPQWR